MKPQTLNELIQHLWAKGASFDSINVYAVLDGARDPEIYPFIAESCPSYRCLYREQLSDALQAAAPYVVKLHQESSYTHELLQKAWGQSWGIFVSTPMSVGIDQLSQHCRKLNKVKGPTGEVMFFRYYDPRVLRSYLPTCHYEELEAVFGPIARIIMEGQSSKQLLQMQRSGDEFIASTPMLMSVSRSA